MVSRVRKITMDLIADDLYAVCKADISHAPQFLLFPDTSNRIVRAAQQKQPDILLLDLLLEILKVYFIMAMLQLQRTVHRHAPVILDCFTERIVNRLLDQDTFPRLCECPDRRCDRKDNAGRFDEPFCLRIPVKMFFIPAANRLKVILFRFTVAVNSVQRCLRKALRYLRNGPKIHIRHPQW